MMDVDILQVEDDSSIQKITSMRAKFSNLSYLGISNYKDFEQDKTSAKVYLIDCNIPKDEASMPEMLAQNIIDTIKSRDYKAKIVLFSNDYRSREIAQKNNVKAIDKMDFKSLDNLLKNLKDNREVAN